jgi:ABC-type Fe3+/spermidine/putrescine transport system ATPase subunit
MEENIAFGLERKRVPRHETKNKVERFVELVKLTGMEKRRPEQLSGGQRQRVALARSLVLSPEVLFLDEPLASLDRKLRKEMQIELKRIQKETDTTFVYVTHDQKVALAMSDRVAVMKQGKILQIGPPDEIYEKPISRFVADFMGFANIFSGKTTDEPGDRIGIITDKGLKLQATLGSDRFDDHPVWVCIRPESIDVVPKDFPLERDNMFVGKIRDIAYQGDFTEIEILLAGGHLLIAHVYSQSEISRSIERLSRNDEVLAAWNKDQCVLLSE